MWRPTNVIPFWLAVGLVFAIVWPPGAVIVLAIVAYTTWRWIAQVSPEKRRERDEGPPG